MSQTAKDIVPSLSGQNTQALVENQGYTYNQTGFSYNQAGWLYGGVFNTGQDVSPTLAKARDVTPSVTVQNTQAQLENQGYTYNQTGFSYDQTGWFYGGIYNTGQDVLPAIVLARLYSPSISGISDIYTPAPPPPSGNSGMLIGMLGLTYP